MRFSRVLTVSVLLVAGLAPIATAHAEGEKSASIYRFKPSADLDLEKIEDIVRSRSADVAAADLTVDLAESDRHQAGVLPNPTFDFTWGTIPLDHGPGAVHANLGNTPSYDFGLSYTIPIGKLGPKQDSADAMIKATRAQRGGTIRASSLQLLGLLGTLATIELKDDELRAIEADATREVQIADVKQVAGFGNGLDIERLKVELSRAEQQELSSNADKQDAIASCSALVGGTCEGFADAASAKAFLERWINRVPVTETKLDDREDVRALDAYRESAQADRVLAKAQGIPDPTVRLGYTHDTFTGNQANSLSLQVSIPLPIFDHGQAQVEAAEAKSQRYLEQRTRLLAAAGAKVPALLSRLEAQRSRKALLEEDAIPHAESVLRDIEKSETASLIPVDQLVDAHRALAELYLEQADAYADAFTSAIALHAELPPTTIWTVAAKPVRVTRPAPPALDGAPSPVTTAPASTAPAATAPAATAPAATTTTPAPAPDPKATHPNP